MMVKAVGVRFQLGGKVYALDPGPGEVAPGMEVAVEGEAGVRIGRVLWGPREVTEAEVSPRLALRLPSQEDRRRSQEFDAWASSCLAQAQEAVSHHNLPMKLWRVEPELDRRRFTIHYASETKVDFRSLARELSSRWKAKVEFHPLGARDESRVLGGLGPCGQPICCARFLSQFTSVAIRMAREQGLAPNPEKLSGLCGRLRCCLGYELAYYLETGKKMPRQGQKVLTPSGPGVVAARNLLRETVVVTLEGNQAVMEWPLEQVSNL